jgi:anti-anti-sigma factor
VVQLIGELDMNTVPAFEEELKRVESTDAREIIVDLRGLASIGADGVKVFIHANARSRSDGNRLVLVHGPGDVQRIFETTGLLSRLPFAESGDVAYRLHSHLSGTHVAA